MPLSARHGLVIIQGHQPKWEATFTGARSCCMIRRGLSMKEGQCL